MEKHTRSKVKASLLTAGDTGNPKFKEDKLYYKPSEVSEKLGVSEEIIRRMFEKDKFKGARKTDGEHLRISKDAFITTTELDTKAKEILVRIDLKSQKAGDVDEFNL